MKRKKNRYPKWTALLLTSAMLVSQSGIAVLAAPADGAASGTESQMTAAMKLQTLAVSGAVRKSSTTGMSPVTQGMELSAGDTLYTEGLSLADFALGEGRLYAGQNTQITVTGDTVDVIQGNILFDSKVSSSAGKMNMKMGSIAVPGNGESRATFSLEKTTPPASMQAALQAAGFGAALTEGLNQLTNYRGAIKVSIMGTQKQTEITLGAGERLITDQAGNYLIIQIGLSDISDADALALSKLSAGELDQIANGLGWNREELQKIIDEAVRRFEALKNAGNSNNNNNSYDSGGGYYGESGGAGGNNNENDNNDDDDTDEDIDDGLSDTQIPGFRVDAEGKSGILRVDTLTQDILDQIAKEYPDLSKLEIYGGTSGKIALEGDVTLKQPVTHICDPLTVGEGTSLTVPEGAEMVIESTVKITGTMNNGGTVTIGDGGVLELGKTDAGADELKGFLKNEGEIIVGDGGMLRVVAGAYDAENADGKVTIKSGGTVYLDASNIDPEDLDRLPSMGEWEIEGSSDPNNKVIPLQIKLPKGNIAERVVGMLTELFGDEYPILRSEGNGELTLVAGMPYSILLAEHSAHYIACQYMEADADIVMKDGVILDLGEFDLNLAPEAEARALTTDACTLTIPSGADVTIRSNYGRIYGEGRERIVINHGSLHLEGYGECLMISARPELETDQNWTAVVYNTGELHICGYVMIESWEGEEELQLLSEEDEILTWCIFNAGGNIYLDKIPDMPDSNLEEELGSALDLQAPNDAAFLNMTLEDLRKMEDNEKLWMDLPGYFWGVGEILATGSPDEPNGLYSGEELPMEETPAVMSLLQEVPEEVPVEEPVETPTEEPVETPTEEPVETPTEEPVETPTEEPVETPTEEPVETPTEEPVETPTEEPAETPVETPTEEPVETPTEEPVETPTEEPVETPTEEPVETPTEEPVETPTEEPVETPTEEPVETPKEESVETPTDEPVETPAEEPTGTIK